MRASRAITTITAAAITVKMMVKASPRPKAAPALRIASNFSQSPMISIESWCSSFATTIILLTRSRTYARAATVNRTAILRLPFGRSAGVPLSSAPDRSAGTSVPSTPERPSGADSSEPDRSPDAAFSSDCSGSDPAAPGMSGVPMMRSASAT